MDEATFILKPKMKLYHTFFFSGFILKQAGSAHPEIPGQSLGDEQRVYKSSYQVHRWTNAPFQTMKCQFCSVQFYLYNICNNPVSEGASHSPKPPKRAQRQHEWVSTKQTWPHQHGEKRTENEESRTLLQQNGQ